MCPVMAVQGPLKGQFECRFDGPDGTNPAYAACVVIDIHHHTHIILLLLQLSPVKYNGLCAT